MGPGKDTHGTPVPKQWGGRGWPDSQCSQQWLNDRRRHQELFLYLTENKFFFFCNLFLFAKGLVFAFADGFCGFYAWDLFICFFNQGVCFSNRVCFFAMGFGLLFLPFFQRVLFLRKRLCLFSAVSLFLFEGFFAFFCNVVYFRSGSSLVLISFSVV